MGTPGTLGCFGWRKQEAVLISAASVIAPARARSGDYLHLVETAEFEPSAQLRPRSRIGRLAEFDRETGFAVLLPEFSAAGNLVLPDRLPSDWSEAAGPITEVLANPEPALLVGKVGRTTGFTSGRVEAVGYRATIQLGPTETATFDDMVLVVAGNEPFCGSGDAGALVFSKTRAAIGIIVAATLPEPRQRVLITPLPRILSRFELAFYASTGTAGYAA